MIKRVRVAVVAASLLLSAVSVEVAGATDAPGAKAPSGTAERAAVRGGARLVTSARQVTEGDRYSLTARIKSARRASKVALQKLDPPAYSFQDPQWVTVGTTKVRNRSKVTFQAVAVETNVEHHRVVVTYPKTKPIVSQRVSVTVWRWIPLSDYDPYYEAEPYAAIFGTTTINGRAYRGWGAATYSHTGTWESRFTPGRHCTAFRGILGVGDISADGSTATIAFTADDTAIYESPALTPGMSLPLVLPLAAKPYRFGIQLTDTTPGSTTGRDEVEAWPVIGEPAFRCTGV